jgi:uncharacterized membrane protein YqjE
MALLDSVGRLAASMTDILQTRLALASLEIEEELQRFLQLLLWSLAAFSAPASLWFCWLYC